MPEQKLSSRHPYLNSMSQVVAIDDGHGLG